jgi:L-asparagine transporter-like permease
MMDKINLNKIFKKWIPIFVIVSLIVITMGLIFHSSVPQIISSIIASVILILSGMFFKSVGRDRDSKKNNFDTSKYDTEVK